MIITLFFMGQIFSNADKVHVAKVLKKLGLEDCFEGIVNFESLNPEKTSNSDDGHENDNEIVAGDSLLLKTPILCKPFEDAFQQAFNIANINPKKTVRQINQSTFYNSDQF